ncbi:TetR/AcrR family transcriptional regulator [Sporichthya brevicatena]|uniref:TetR/AcrR family transcriptional regulator n=1 Tax=Sporichthya brevicatena TaxID=171442 RepID=A0ABN1GIL6_9ACTN
MDNRGGIKARRQAARDASSRIYRDRREEIIRGAAAAFRELGFENATLTDVAERVGTDRASLYYYVSNKEELMQEIVRMAVKDNFLAARRIDARKAAPAQKIEMLIREMIESFHRNYPYLYVYVEDMARISRLDTEWSHDVQRTSRRFESIVMRILTQGQADGTFRADVPVHLASLNLFGMINWTHRWYTPDSEYTPEEVIQSITEIFFRGHGGPALADSGTKK